MIISRRAGTVVTAFVLVGTVLAAPFVPPAAASWLGFAALATILWPLLADPRNPTAIALGHIGSVAACFALGVHDAHRTVWVALLATLAAIPLAWALRGRQRAIKAIGGLILGALTFSVFVWSTEQLGNEPLSKISSMLLLGTGAGIVMIVQALRRAKAPATPIPVHPEPPAKPMLPSWALDVTEPRAPSPDKPSLNA